MDRITHLIFCSSIEQLTKPRRTRSYFIHSFSVTFIGFSLIIQLIQMREIFETIFHFIINVKIYYYQQDCRFSDLEQLRFSFCSDIKEKGKEDYYQQLFFHFHLCLSICKRDQENSVIQKLKLLKENIIVSMYSYFFYSLNMRNSKLKSKSSGCLQSKKSKIVNNMSPSKPEIFQPFCSNLIHAQKLSKGSISPKSQFPKSIKREKERDSSKQKQATCNVLDLFKKIVDNLSTRSSKLEEKNTFVLRKSIEKKKINQEGESSKDTLTTQINSNRAGKHKKIECYPEQKSSKQESLSMLIPKTLKLRKNTSQKQKDTILSYMTLSNQTVGDRINYHLDALSVLSDYVQSWWRSNKDEEEWQQLYFLIYKKYYLERVKVHNFLKKYPIKNPFCLKNAQIQTRQTITFMKSNEGKVRLHKLGFQNMKIKEKLRDYYNFIINKSGGPINLFQVDNFSQVIYKQMWNSFIMIEFCCWMAKQRKMIKMCRILQIGFIISELEGRFIAPLHKVQEAIRTLTLQPYIKQNRELYNKFLAP